MAARSGYVERGIGGYDFDPLHTESIEELLVKADTLMYEQKRAGKKQRDGSQPAGSNGAAPVAS